MAFTFTKLRIPEVMLVEAQAFGDERGFFEETFKQSMFTEKGIDVIFVQDNHSHSIKGVLRGLHYQMNPRAQAKLIGVVRGKIFDVAVDIRKGSPTYGKWISEVLSEENHRMLYVPAAFAHGFCVLSKEADVVYKVSEEYAPECDRGIIWNDPEIGIKWPVENPLLSDKDASLPMLKDAENNFVYRVQNKNLLK